VWWGVGRDGGDKIMFMPIFFIALYFSLQCICDWGEGKVFTYTKQPQHVLFKGKSLCKYEK